MPNYARLDALIISSAVQDQLEALMEIQALIPLECEDDSSKLTSFANFLRLPFGSSRLSSCVLGIFGSLVTASVITGYNKVP